MEGTRYSQHAWYHEDFDVYSLLLTPEEEWQAVERWLTMVDVSPADFLKLHGDLVRVLMTIEKAGPDAACLPTRKLSEDFFNSRTYGWKILLQAEDIGYIKRKRVLEPKVRAATPTR